MGRFGGTKVKALTVGLVLSLFALVGTTVWGLLQGLLALLAPGSQPVLAAMLGAVAPWLLASVLLILVSGGLLLWLVIALASRISIPSPRLESERLSRLAAGVEYYVPAARAVELSDWLAPPAPTAEEKLAQVKEDYVEGKISGETFERKIEQLHREEAALDRSSMPSRLDELLDDADARERDAAGGTRGDELSETAVADAMDVTVVEERDDDEPATEQA
ncbi:hypothetical protein [Haloarchaeobius iranensis]|uniref:Short C-terminal domain-containing protein n=1 Tax=Haloarchaeobius iranensis TaxID=996166 RepID=A0A1G9YET6_9EURY|nr:hypothetical protein [Haloarchaeobius iranensis]SDN07537.1 hypothetical protein SAMN05192554_11427 [Haloarchaeobius iranensis]